MSSTLFENTIARSLIDSTLLLLLEEFFNLVPNIVSKFIERNESVRRCIGESLVWRHGKDFGFGLGDEFTNTIRDRLGVVLKIDSIRRYLEKQPDWQQETSWN